MPRPVRPTSALGQRGERGLDPAPPPPDVVAVHDPDECPVGVAVEAVDELVALVVEVGVDREPAVRLAGTPEPPVEVDLRAVRGHRELAGEGEAFVAEPVHELELDVVPGDGHRTGRRGRRDRDDVVDAVRPLQRDLERDHPAQRAAGDDGPPVDPERICQRPQGPGFVARRRPRGKNRPTAGPFAGWSTAGRSTRSCRRGGSRTGRRRRRCRRRGPGR